MQSHTLIDLNTSAYNLKLTDKKHYNSLNKNQQQNKANIKHIIITTSNQAFTKWTTT